MTDVQLETFEQALEPLREMLASDGYALRVTPGPASLTINIDATPEACAECLAPADTIEFIVVDRLRAAGVQVDGLRVDVLLPPKA
jgi:hypothetical protein